MMTSKERAALRAQANPLEVTLIVGKSGISQTLLDEAVILLDSHELVKGRVLETAGLTAREASDMLCEALGAEGIACVGTKFVIWRKSEKLAQEKKKAAARKPAKKKPSGNDNPVKAGLRARQEPVEMEPVKILDPRTGTVLRKIQSARELESCLFDLVPRGAPFGLYLPGCKITAVVTPCGR